LLFSFQIPCWDSFRLNPCQWRGPCFGRTFKECYFTGLRQTRWARGAYAGAISPEFLFPVQNIGRHSYTSDIQALCWMYFSMGCVFGCGIGQIFSLCGNLGCNFGACYSCHSRERLRRRFNLPPAFALPPGIDDFLVHFFCLYCASHQELREMALRGVDGPGMHIFDVLPDSFRDVDGIEELVAKRKKVVDEMMAHPPKLFVSRKKNLPNAPIEVNARPGENEAASDDGGGGPVSRQSSLASEKSTFGWARAPLFTVPSECQTMNREERTSTTAGRHVEVVSVPLRRVHSDELIMDLEYGEGGGGGGEDDGELDNDGRYRVSPRAWSVAY
jgi:Cys-rich protein (TIGR01571 family)